MNFNWKKFEKSAEHLKYFFKHFAGGLYSRADEHHIFLLASGLAFTLFVCIVPFTLIIFSVLGSILESPTLTAELHSIISRAIPYSKYASFIQDFIIKRVNEFLAYKSTAGIIGLVGILFAASGLFSSMRTILNLVYHVKITPSAIIGKLKDLGLVLVVLVYFVLSTTVLPAINILGQFADKLDYLRTLRLTFVEDLILNGVSFFIIFIFFFGIYFLVPQERIPRQATFVSAFSAAFLWEIAKQLFGFYIAHVVTLKKMYGAYSLVIVTAFWIYYTSIIFIIGAEIGQLYREWRNRRVLTDY